LGILDRFRGKTNELSLEEQMHNVGAMKAMLEAGLQAWRGAVQSLLDRMPAHPKGIAEETKRGLREFQQEIAAVPGPDAIRNARTRLDDLLKVWGRQIDQEIVHHERQMKGVLASVAEMTEGMAGLDQRFSVRLTGISRKLRDLAASNDLNEIREKVAAEVAQLERYTEEHSRDTRSALARLEEGITIARKPLRGEDPPDIRKANNNNILEAQRARPWLDQRCALGGRFCVVRVTLEDEHYRAVAWKGVPGKAVLQEAVSRFGEKLDRPFQSFRWQENTLLIAVESNLLELAKLSSELEGTLGGSYSAMEGYRFKAILGVAEFLKGEQVDKLLQRIALHPETMQTQ
jgi:hypothetical protein